MMNSTLGLNKEGQLERFRRRLCVAFGWFKYILYGCLCSMQEYYDLLHEFMMAVKQNYGEKVLIQVRICYIYMCLIRLCTYWLYLKLSV